MIQRRSFDRAGEGTRESWPSDRALVSGRLEPFLHSLERGGYSVELGPGMAELIETWAKNWVESHDNASKEAANKAGADWMLRLLAGYFQGRLRKAASVGKSGPYLAAKRCR